jgi:hypothetical protein
MALFASNDAKTLIKTVKAQQQSKRAQRAQILLLWCLQSKSTTLLHEWSRAEIYEHLYQSSTDAGQHQRDSCSKGFVQMHSSRTNSSQFSGRSATLKRCAQDLAQRKAQATVQPARRTGQGIWRQNSGFDSQIDKVRDLSRGLHFSTLSARAGSAVILHAWGNLTFLHDDTVAFVSQRLFSI